MGMPKVTEAEYNTVAPLYTLLASHVVQYIPFILILNVHFLNYYVPSRAYVGKPPSTISTRLF